MSNDSTASDGSRTDDADAAADQLEPLDSGAGWERWYSYAYLTLLVALPIAALALGIRLGYVDPNVTVTATVDLGTAAEWLVTGLVVLFLFWTTVQVVRVTGIGFVRGVVRAAARIADAYELPQDDQERE